MSKKTDANYIKILHSWCNVIAVLSPHEFGDLPSTTSTKFKLYTALQIVLSTIYYIYSDIGRTLYLYDDLDVTVTVTDRVVNFISSLLTFLIRVLLIFVYDRNVQLFFTSAYSVSKQCQFGFIAESTFKAQFILVHLVLLILVAIDAYVWTSTVGWFIFRFYVARSLCFIINNITTYLIFQIVLFIKNSIKSFRLSLGIILQHLYLEEDLQCLKNTGVQNYSYLDVKAITILYGKICQLAQDFNKIFGIIILIEIFFCITCMLNLTDLVLVYSVSKSNIQGTAFGFNLIAICCLWIAALFVFNVLLAYACTGAISEADQLLGICFDWLHKLPTAPRTSSKEKLREEILALIHLITSRPLKFSAGGFFNIDYTMLNLIIGSVTSYVIVVSQFIK